MPSTEDLPVSRGLDRLRHDLLNPLNVIVGATSALMQTELDEGQRSWLRMLDSSIKRLQSIIERIDAYRTAPGLDGRARLADLCSIAEARVAKPIVRGRLIDAIRQVVGDNQNARILLVDDSPELVTLVRAYLESTKWEVDVVETGERAVAKATTEPYDVVLMDIDLPGLDGATAAHAIRAADLARGASPTPVIAMTASIRVQRLATTRWAPPTRSPSTIPKSPRSCPSFWPTAARKSRRFANGSPAANSGAFKRRRTR